jgi:hypothetical protein
MSTTAVWILVVAAVGVIPGLLLTRTVLRSRRPQPAPPAAAPAQAPAAGASASS